MLGSGIIRLIADGKCKSHELFIGVIGLTLTTTMMQATSKRHRIALLHFVHFSNLQLMNLFPPYEVK